MKIKLIPDSYFYHLIEHAISLHEDEIATLESQWKEQEEKRLQEKEKLDKWREERSWWRKFANSREEYWDDWYARIEHTRKRSDYTLDIANRRSIVKDLETIILFSNINTENGIELEFSDADVRRYCFLRARERMQLLNGNINPEFDPEDEEE